MTFYQELQLNQAGSKSLLKNSKTMKEKLYNAFVYMVKIAVTMVFCFNNTPCDYSFKRCISSVLSLIHI